MSKLIYKNFLFTSFLDLHLTLCHSKSRRIDISIDIYILNPEKAKMNKKKILLVNQSKTENKNI